MCTYVWICACEIGEYDKLSTEFLDDDDNDDSETDNDEVVSSALLQLAADISAGKEPAAASKEPAAASKEPAASEEPVTSEQPVETASDIVVLASREENIRSSRSDAKTGQDKQAKKMLRNHKRVINSYKVGEVVMLSCEAVDRGQTDPENLLCYILSIEKSQFVLGCKVGVLNNTFPFNAFSKSTIDP